MGFIGVCERIGESIASVLGLDDSHFQEYIDQMTPEQLQQALDVHQQREQENAAYTAAADAPGTETGGDAGYTAVYLNDVALTMHDTPASTVTLAQTVEYNNLEWNKR
jgi:hypothetical protein